MPIVRTPKSKQVMEKTMIVKSGTMNQLNRSVSQELEVKRANSALNFTEQKIGEMEDMTKLSYKSMNPRSPIAEESSYIS